jgi:hypothetical protein
LEFGADDAFILVPDEGGEAVTLKHLKARHTEPKDLRLEFNRRIQRFSAAENSRARKPGGGKMQSALAALWDRTPPATDDPAEGEP